MAREGHEVVAVDGSISGLAKADKRLSAESLPFLGVACCVTALPFTDSSFDACIDVVCSAHNPIHDIHRIFSEVARVVKPEGKIFSILPTNLCSHTPFEGRGSATFFEWYDVDKLFRRYFDKTMILHASYETEDYHIDNWVVSAQNRRASWQT